MYQVKFMGFIQKGNEEELWVGDVQVDGTSYRCTNDSKTIAVEHHGGTFHLEEGGGVSPVLPPGVEEGMMIAAFICHLRLTTGYDANNSPEQSQI